MLGFAAVASFAAKDDTTLVSRADGAGGAKGDGRTADPAISGDGRYVAFSSLATNIHPDDTDDTEDVFVRDLQTSSMVLVSRASGANGAKGSGPSGGADIASDGRHVVFYSFSPDLDPADGDTTPTVYARGLDSDVLELVSRASGANGAVANGESFEAAVSADGRYVAFVSRATNLHPDDTDNTIDVFVRDLESDTTALVSRGSGANGAKGDSSSYAPSISADGRYVAFQSAATNLDPDDADGAADVYVRDLQANTTTLASRASGAAGAHSDGSSGVPSISADGRRLTFASSATNLHPDDTGSAGSAFVRDLETNTTMLASRASGADGANDVNGTVQTVISADGRYVAFVSNAKNFDPADTDNRLDIYVRDLQGNTTTLVSRATGADGAKSDEHSSAPAISGDGRYVAFESGARNLDAADTDLIKDVYVRDVLGARAGPGGGGTPASCPAGTSATVVCVIDAQGRLAMTGTDADETFVGTDGPDRISPLGGNDVVNGNGGDDLISGGPGDDELHGGPGNDRMNGNAGNDEIAGNEGDDSISGRAGNDRLSGGDGDDGLWGGPGDDSISGGAGNDRLRGQGGDDNLMGNAGRDLLSAGSGDDRLDGGPGRDRLRCGVGNDTVVDTAGDDLSSRCRGG